MQNSDINWFVKLLRNKRAKNRLEIHVDAMEASVSPPIEPVIAHLKDHFNAVVTVRHQDGMTDAGHCELRVEDHDVVVHQSEYYDIAVFAKDPGAESLIERIAESLKQELSSTS